MFIEIHTEQSGWVDLPEKEHLYLSSPLGIGHQSKEDLDDDFELFTIQKMDDSELKTVYIPLTRKEAYLLAKTLLTMLECTTE
jgi:hypothetical protein